MPRFHVREIATAVCGTDGASSPVEERPPASLFGAHDRDHRSRSRPDAQTRVAQQLRRALVGLKTSAVHVRVGFTDVNGPKGCLDVRCAIDVRLPQTAPFHVEDTNRSATAISRQIAQRLEPPQESGRRPKKYYAVRRLL